MAATIIKQCVCKSDFQDQRYGKGKRVFNVRPEGRPPRCTVCGREA